MDVKDRAARIDVLNLPAPGKEAPGAPGIAVKSDGAFASSLRSQGKGAANPAASAGAVDEAGLASTDGTNPAQDDVSSPLLSELLLTALPRDGVPETLPDNDFPPQNDEEIDSAARQFLASIAAANCVPQPQQTPVIETAPPALARAISVLAEQSANLPAIMPVPAEPPKMPAGLQLAMTEIAAGLTNVEGVAAQQTQTNVGTAAGAPAVSELSGAAAKNMTPADVKGLESSKTPAPIVDEDTTDKAVSATRTAELAPATPQISTANRSTLNFAGSEHSPDGVIGRAVASANRLPASVAPADERDRSTELPTWSASAHITRSELQTEHAAGLPKAISAAPAIVDQLAPALARAVAGERPLSIVLRPPELGAIRIDISQPAGQLSARLEVESPAAHQLLNDSLPHLREVLAPLGVAADQVQIVRMDGASSGMESGWRADGQTDAGTSGRGHDAPSQQPTEPQWLDEPERDDRSAPAVQTRTAINLRI